MNNGRVLPLLKNDPQIVGDWKLLGRLGSGGMGVVYYGVDFKKSTENEVALKIIREHILEDSSARSRLEREIDSLHAIDSPYVARIVASEIDSSPAWIATQRVNGPSLTKWVEDNGPLDIHQWLNLAYGMLHAINSIHNAGIIHRDIKPSNVLLEQQGNILVPKLIDFGIAVDQGATSLTRTGMLVGTPAWLAPEQFLGDALTESVDLFAIGSTLLFAATGKNLWGLQDTTPIGVIIGTITSGTPNLDDLSKDQKQLLAPLLQKKPEKRIGAIEALAIVESIAKENDLPLLQLGTRASATNEQRARSRSKSITPSKRTLLYGGGLVGALIGVALVIFGSTPTQAKVTIELTSTYLNAVCVSTSGLQGIEGSQVFIKIGSDDTPLFLGKLDEGTHQSGNTCSYVLPINGYDPDISNYQLQINFPWDVYSEDFKFANSNTKSPNYNLKLKLD